VLNVLRNGWRVERNDRIDISIWFWRRNTMKQKIIEIRNKILAGKVYIGRSAGYVSLLNLGMIMFLTISKLKEVGMFNVDIGSYIIPLYFLTLFIFMIFGYIDIKILKGHKTETDIINNVTPLHPELAQLKRKIDYLYEQGIKRK
jgi:hypothetical protein